MMKSTLRSLLPTAKTAHDTHQAAGHDQHLRLGAGYDHDQVREVVAELGYTAHMRPHGAEAQAKKAGQKARRWVVERTCAWLNRFRYPLAR